MNKRLALLYWCLGVPYLFLDAYYYFYWWINFAVLTLFIWLIIMILKKIQIRFGINAIFGTIFPFGSFYFLF